MPKGGSLIEYPIKKFLGLNLLDAGDQVRDNEFTRLQNVWQPSRGVFNPRFGSVIDQSSFPLCSRISGVWRHYSPTGDRFSIYHCVPDSTLLPDNTTDLVLSEVSSPVATYDLFGGSVKVSNPITGNLFGGGAVVPIRVCYSWIGRGAEQTYNSKSRAGFPSVGSFPLDAWNNPGHQSITLLSANSFLQVTVPAFPVGITGANIFAARGTATEMTYMGTVTTSGGSLVLSEFVGPTAAASDKIALAGSISPSALNLTNGTLRPGTYWIACAWMTDPGVKEGGTSLSSVPVQGNGIGTQVLTVGTLVDNPTVSGSLNAGSQYDAILTAVDTTTGLETYVSPVFSATTASSSSSLKMTAPALPAGTSSFNLYIGLHGQKTADGTPVSPTRYQSGILGSAVVNVTSDPNQQTFRGPTAPSLGFQSNFIKVSVTGNQNAIQVTAPVSISTNGAKSIYVFIGTQDPTQHPMTFVGVIRAAAAPGFLDILSIPTHNAQSSPFLFGTDLTQPQFWHQVNDQFVGGFNLSIGSRFQSRFGFLLASKNGGSLQEVFPSRTLLLMMFNFKSVSVFAGDSPQQNVAFDLHNFAPQPKTQNDRYQTNGTTGYSQPYPWQNSASDPVFAYQLGLSYMANGVDILWQTDGYTLGQLGCVTGPSQTILPPIPRFVFTFQNSIVVAGADNQIYASNANAPQNWATGGSGTLLRFVTIGDSTGPGVSACGVFTPSSDSPNNPGSYLIGFKKSGCWMTAGISDPSASVLTGLLGGQVPSPMVDISGEVGCVAYRSVVQTPVGTLFLGQDANIYLINRVGPPQRMGTKVQNALLHLVGNDPAMKSVTAVYHDRHYKMSYPSAIAAKATPIVNDLELWADLRTETGPTLWMGPHVGRNIGPQVVLRGENDDGSRLVADGSVARTYTADTTASLTDLAADGSAQNIAQSILSKLYRFGEEGHVKRLLGAIIDAYIDYSFTNNLLFQGFADQYYQQVNRNISSGGAVWDSSKWDQTNFADAMWNEYSLLMGPDNLIGRVFQWGLSKSDPAPFSLNSVTLLLKPERRNLAL